ncbi:F0F1 ATP synthase subunit B [Mycoplasmatota bacterium WC30]
MTTMERIMQAVSEAIDAALGVSLLDMVIQIAATLILVLIVKKFFWGRITDFLEKRKEIMTEELESAKNANQEALALQEKTDKKYQDLRAKSKEYLDKAKFKGEEERQGIVEKARGEAKNILTQAEQEIALEKKKASSEIQKEAITLATLMASKIIEEELDDKKYQDLAVENLERSEKV